MTNGEISDAAIRLSGETSANDCPDYVTRSERLLTLIYRSLAPLDRDIRAAKGLDPQGTITNPSSVNGICPLTDDLVPAVSYLLASFLTIDENASLSEVMRSHYEAAIADVRARIPMKGASTKNVYPGIL